jgi:CheY-like chemotaxis protein/anti-sigma regulatory factor (Ser/Thr protein kinase)
MMPVMDGFHLVADIRADPELAPLPVIMLSARAGAEASGDGLAAGADNYLVKPFSSADLINAVAARLGAAERDRSRAPQDELTARRALALAEIGSALANAQTMREILQILLASPLCSLGATAVGIGVLDETRGLLRITYLNDMNAERYHLADIDASIPMVDTVRTGQPSVVPDTARLDPRDGGEVADVAPEGRACIIEPLCAEDGSVIGALALSWPEPRQFSPADLGVAERAADMAARAVTRIGVAEREHQIAVALQERLLDLGTGSPAAVVSALYQPAGETMRVGGDWYTVTAIDDHRIGVSAGDVVGHGLPAAAVMSQLRSALGAAALAAAEPAAVLDVLDRYARSLHEATFATVAYAIVDAEAGTVDYTCAGHPYPLIVAPDGTVSYLRDGRRPPLATKSPGVRRSVGHSAIAPGSLLLLYTDGLIERRAEPLDAGFARLAAAAADCARLPAGAACTRLLARMAGDHGYDDDVAMVAVRPVGTTATSHVDALHASFAELGPARSRLRAWLHDLGVPSTQAYGILLGTGEALSNAIEHGSGLDSDRTVGLEAFSGRQEITATVTDTGHWTRDSAAAGPPANRGRGLKLIGDLSDDVQIVRTARGTRVTMTYRIG